MPGLSSLLSLRRLRAAPTLWAAEQLARHAKRRWDGLPEADRRELTRLVRKSRGRRGNLTAAERSELDRIVRSALRRRPA